VFRPAALRYVQTVQVNQLQPECSAKGSKNRQLNGTVEVIGKGARTVWESQMFVFVAFETEYLTPLPSYRVVVLR
jgi:hypothetical protein